ncbi:hypothetical protein HQ529_01500 [Candidatus Woesearchaeota archaeon]|nr:hypothetical protein [Candidatus Woesearchaeota archaeon]
MRIILLLLLFTGCTSNVVKENIVENVKIEVYFCPEDDCERILFNFLNSSEKSIHCALYDLDLDKIIKLLEEKQAKLIIDDNNYQNFSFDVKKDSSSRVMHNKFCVVDEKKVFTGSFNPTEKGAYFNNNNMLIIESSYISRNYEDEFNELWFNLNQTKISYPIVNYHIENYFCPEDNCGKEIIEEIRAAKSSIYFMMFSFTHPEIANELVLKHYEGIEVKGVMESRQISKYSRFDLFKFQGINVKKDNNKHNMHHKVFIIDNETVITGSFNPTKNGDYKNDENIIIINDKNIAKLFLEEFRELW